MATASIEKRLARLLAKRAQEHADRAKELKRIGKRRYQRRRLQWKDKQRCWLDTARGAAPTPDYMTRAHPYDILRKGYPSPSTGEK